MTCFHITASFSSLSLSHAFPAFSLFISGTMSSTYQLHIFLHLSLCLSSSQLFRQFFPHVLSSCCCSTTISLVMFFFVHFPLSKLSSERCAWKQFIVFCICIWIDNAQTKISILNFVFGGGRITCRRFNLFFNRQTLIFKVVTSVLIFSLLQKESVLSCSSSLVFFDVIFI